MLLVAAISPAIKMRAEAKRQAQLLCLSRAPLASPNTKKERPRKGISGALVEVELWLEDDLGSNLDLPGTGGAIGPGEGRL